MEESILKFIRTNRVGNPDDTSFDAELIMYINSELVTLQQLGIINGYIIEDENAKWSDIIPDQPEYSIVKAYIDAQVHLKFDPPSGTAVLQSLENIIKEYQWRIQHLVLEKENSVTKDKRC